MRIAVVGPTYPHRGGIAHYTTLLASHLSQHYLTRLYSFRQQYPNYLFPGRSQLDPSPAPLVEVDARRWLVPWLPPTWWRVKQDWVAWQPSLMIFQWWVPFMAPMTIWLARQAHRSRACVVMVCHNVLPHERGLLDTHLARLALRQADRLVVHSALDHTLARTLLPSCAVEVVPHPSYAAFASPAWSREKARAALGVPGRVLLFFGIVRPYKGLSDLLNALPAVLAEIDVTLLVVGEIWEDAETYRQQVKALGLQSHVQFIDRYVSNDEAAMYFTAADLAVLPYRHVTSSGVLQLAFGMGVPVIATHTGGTAEVVEDGKAGFLVEPGDVAGLGRAIVRFFREERAADMRAFIERSQSKFTWEAMVNAVLKPIQEQTQYADS